MNHKIKQFSTETHMGFMKGLSKFCDWWEISPNIHLQSLVDLQKKTSVWIAKKTPAFKNKRRSQGCKYISLQSFYLPHYLNTRPGRLSTTLYMKDASTFQQEHTLAGASTERLQWPHLSALLLLASEQPHRISQNIRLSFSSSKP